MALRRVADMICASSGLPNTSIATLCCSTNCSTRASMKSPLTGPASATNLRQMLADHAGDTEREMDILREVHHAQVFRLLAQDLAGLQTIESLSDHLTELADTIVQETLPLVWSTIKKRHCEVPKFAIIGYGKMGGKELGYASDLDMVYLFDDDSQDARKITPASGSGSIAGFRARHRPASCLKPTCACARMATPGCWPSRWTPSATTS
jgi:glutamate-ammonia-ligase adenylyltransferase